MSVYRRGPVTCLLVRHTMGLHLDLLFDQDLLSGTTVGPAIRISSLVQRLRVVVVSVMSPRSERPQFDRVDRSRRRRRHR